MNKQPKDKAELEEAFNNTFPGLTMYYRDCDLNPEFISKYQIGQILMERGFTDVSNFAKGLNKNLRYAIASNKAVNMKQANPNVAKFGFHLISAPSHYKVLDIYTIGDKTQILLMHFEAQYKAIFESTTSNIEEKVIGMGRKSLDDKIKMALDVNLNSEEWTKRTEFPIGTSDKGEFFLSASDNKPDTEPNVGKNTSTETSESKPNVQKEKKGFWGRLFK